MIMVLKATPKDTHLCPNHNKPTVDYYCPLCIIELQKNAQKSSYHNALDIIREELEKLQKQGKLGMLHYQRIGLILQKLKENMGL